eukprot:1158760-Pelagomonas_calceolata.AAC.3
MTTTLARMTSTMIRSANELKASLWAACLIRLLEGSVISCARNMQVMKQLGHKGGADECSAASCCMQSRGEPWLLGQCFRVQRDVLCSAKVRPIAYQKM